MKKFAFILAVCLLAFFGCNYFGDYSARIRLQNDTDLVLSAEVGVSMIDIPAHTTTDYQTITWTPPAYSGSEYKNPGRVNVVVYVSGLPPIVRGIHTYMNGYDYTLVVVYDPLSQGYVFTVKQD